MPILMVRKVLLGLKRHDIIFEGTKSDRALIVPKGTTLLLIDNTENFFHEGHSWVKKVEFFRNL